MAQSWGFPLLQDKDPATYDLYDILQFVGNIIFVLLSIAGAIAVIYIIVGGYKYVFAAGNPETQTEAKKTLTWAIIGLMICLTAVLILRFVWSGVTGGQLPTNVPQRPTTSSSSSDVQSQAIDLCNKNKPPVTSQSAWEKGPCLIDNLNNTGYAVDIAHQPRQAIDDRNTNTCSSPTKWVELDTSCNIINIQN